MDLIQFYVTVGLMLFSGGLGYYMGERGWSGVQIDLGNIKNDIAHIQGRIGASQTQVVTPVANSQPTSPATVITTPRI